MRELMIEVKPLLPSLSIFVWLEKKKMESFNFGGKKSKDKKKEFL
jgi:hypothetical protein